MIIGLNGYGGSGKDAIGAIIQYLKCENTGEVSLEEAIKDYQFHQYWLEDQSGWEIKKWAGKLKEIATLITGLPMETWESQILKKQNLPSEWNVHGMPMTIRDLLQKIGTDAMRDGLHTNVWVNAFMSEYNCVPADRAPNGWDCPNWVATDTRFPNEAKAVKDKGGIMIRVNRPGIGPANDHISEVSLDDWKYDYVIDNNGTISDLAEKIKYILNEKHI